MITDTTGARAITRTRRGLSYRELYPYLLITPALAVMALVLVYPFVSGVWISFHRDTLMSQERPFIGLANYQAVFAIPAVATVLRVTLIWTVAVACPPGVTAPAGPESVTAST